MRRRLREPEVDSKPEEEQVAELDEEGPGVEELRGHQQNEQGLNRDRHETVQRGPAGHDRDHGQAHQCGRPEPGTAGLNGPKNQKEIQKVETKFALNIKY